MLKRCLTVFFVAVGTVLLTLPVCYATGMQPETTLLIIEEGQRGGSMNVRNTDSMPNLLYTQVVEMVEQDREIELLAMQPVVRVEPDETQQVRFVLKTTKPLQTEHLKRVTFEGIPPKGSGSRLGFTVKQDLPVLIRPKHLPEMLEPWNALTWRLTTKGLVVTNPSPYVVRLADTVNLLPSGTEVNLGKRYILPQDVVTIAVPKTQVTHAPLIDSSVTFQPVSRYGSPLPHYTASLRQR